MLYQFGKFRSSLDPDGEECRCRQVSMAARVELSPARAEYPCQVGSTRNLYLVRHLLASGSLVQYNGVDKRQAGFSMMTTHRNMPLLVGCEERNHES